MSQFGFTSVASFKDIPNRLKDRRKSNHFMVSAEYRTNHLSHVPGGGIVKVIYDDGSERVYNNIKDTGFYSKKIQSENYEVSVEILVASSFSDFE